VTCTGRAPQNCSDGRSVDGVTTADNAFGSFLASRRAKITPEEVGLPAGGSRRVPGLRRGELATLAGVSVEYVARLERGAVHGVSESVLDALSRALKLDEAEHEHLLDLARMLMGTARKPRSRKQRRFYPEWDSAADDIVAILRTEAGRDPFDRGLSELVGELSTRSDEFRVRWAAQNVRHHYTGLKHFHHPVVGTLHLHFEAMDLSADDGLTLLIYPAVVGSPDADALQLLAGWQASQTVTNAEVKN
jgi:transcriptional regulator with XRE-family HTH domain